MTARKWLLLAGLVACSVLVNFGNASSAQEYGYAVKRPIIGAACPTCVWGPIAEIVKEIMAPKDWDIQICWNCNVSESPRFVAQARVPHDLTPGEMRLGDPPPPKGPVDFGVTSERLLRWSYDGQHEYQKDGPQKHLRLIAFLEDPGFLVVAVDKKSGITDLAQIRERKMPVRIFIGNANDLMVQPILDWYGITPKDVESWGGKFVGGRQARSDGVDVIINRQATTANNVEASIWGWASQTKDLAYLTLPQELRDRLMKTGNYIPVTLRREYFRGVTDPIPTLGVTGQVIYGRADMPDDFAYTLAKTVDEERRAFLFSIRPFIVDPRTVWKLADIPLHPAAERYYREVGYMK